MVFSVCSFGVALYTVFLAAQVCDARDLPSAGLLDDMPKNCSDVNFCLEKHVDYPQELIDELLSKKYELTFAISDAELGDRDGNELDQSQTDCKKTSTYGEIYEIIDEHKNVRVVVQSPKLFKQLIRIEKCVKKGRLFEEGGTKHFNQEILKDHDIFCDEKEMNHSFLVLTRDGNEVEFVNSNIPVCCSCRLHDKNKDKKDHF